MKLIFCNKQNVAQITTENSKRKSAPKFEWFSSADTTTLKLCRSDPKLHLPLSRDTWLGQRIQDSAPVQFGLKTVRKHTCPFTIHHWWTRFQIFKLPDRELWQALWGAGARVVYKWQTTTAHHHTAAPGRLVLSTQSCVFKKYFWFWRHMRAVQSYDKSGIKAPRVCPCQC